MMSKTLPASWVDKLFLRLIGAYGRDFLMQFSSLDANGVDVGLANAKEVWAEELGGFADNPEAIAYALRNLPTDRAPNVFKFREICRHAPPKSVVALTHKYTPEEIERNKQRAREAIEMLAKKKSINNGGNHDKV